MATTHTTRLARGGQFSGWKMLVLLAGSVAIVATLAGGDIFSRSAGQVAPARASLHNLIEGIDVSGSASAAPEAVAPTVGAVTNTAEFEIRPNLPEGIDSSFAAPGAQAGASDYSAFKVEQARGDLQGIKVVPGDYGASDYSAFKLEQARGGGAPVNDRQAPISSEPHVRNLVEGP